MTPEVILEAYRHGYFPMAESSDAKNFFMVSPENRGLIPIEEMHIPRSLLKSMRQKPFEITVDQNFTKVIDLCAEITKQRPDTWINKSITKLFIELHDYGYAHSIECYKDGRMIGGLYGLAIGATFFGESMFSRESNASKTALVHLVARLWKGGFKMLDTQWTNPHLEQFGCHEIPREQYLERLNEAVKVQAEFNPGDLGEEEILDEYLLFRGLRTL